MGIEPTLPAWKAGVLPLNYARIRGMISHTTTKETKEELYLLIFMDYYSIWYRQCDSNTQHLVPKTSVSANWTMAALYFKNVIIHYSNTSHSTIFTKNFKIRIFNFHIFVHMAAIPFTNWTIITINC